MNNLLNFIWRHHFTFLFLLLEVVSFFILVQSNKFQNANFLSSTNEISGSIYAGLNNLTEYIELKKTNEDLARENARLNTYSKNSFIKISGDFLLLSDTVYKQQYKYLNAKVINSSTTKRNNFLVIDRGRVQGIEPGMGVICSNGVVGIINKVSENFSSVISLLHKETKISAKLKKNDYFGIASWEGGNYEYATLSDIPRHVELIKGDTIVTRSGSGIFPEGILLGWVDEFEVPPGENYFNIRFRLSTEFNRLTYVYVVKNILKNEQEILENDFKE